MRSAFYCDWFSIFVQNQIPVPQLNQEAIFNKDLHRLHAKRRPELWIRGNVAPKKVLQNQNKIAEAILKVRF